MSKWLKNERKGDPLCERKSREVCWSVISKKRIELIAKGGSSQPMMESLRTNLRGTRITES